MSNKYIKSLTANFDVLQVGSFIRFADGSKLESSTVSQTGFSDKTSVTPSVAVANPIDLGQYRRYSTPQALNSKPNSNSLTAQSGQPLTLTGSDAGGTVLINGTLQVKGTIDYVNKTTLNIADLTINVAHSDSGAQADSAADSAGLVVETGTSGYARSLLWHVNQGIAYKPASASAGATDDGVSYWEVKGGNLVLTRVIPAANHISWSYSTVAYAADNTQTTVSYRFAISDDEKLVVEKSAGAKYAAGAGSNNTVQPVGSAAPVVAVFELPTSSTS